VRRSWITEWASNLHRCRWFCPQRWKRTNYHRLCIAIRRTIYYTIFHHLRRAVHCQIRYCYRVEKIALTLKWTVPPPTIHDWIHGCNASSWYNFMSRVWYASFSNDIEIMTKKCNKSTKSSFGIITKTLFTFMSGIHTRTIFWRSQVKNTTIQQIVQKFSNCPQWLLWSPRNLSQMGLHTSWDDLSCLGFGTSNTMLSVLVQLQYPRQ
jgi:hypothetical protein